EDNFTGTVIYDFDDAYLRCGTVAKLVEVEAELEEYGYRIMIWDAFRPASAQWTLWNVWPDADYVADPTNGYSSHTRGNTVDVTLVGMDGEWMRMPSDFDDFSALADRDFGDVDFEDAVANAMTLQNVMTAHGFIPYDAEWWHFSDSDEYEVETEFAPPSKYEVGSLDWFNNVYFSSALSRHFLNSEYGDAADVDLYFLFYDGAGSSELISPEELEAFRVKADYEDIYTDVTKVTSADVNETLLKYTGKTLDETNKVRLDSFTYLEEYDAYYHMHGDTNANNYVMDTLVRDEPGIVRLTYYGWSGEQYVVSLTETENGTYYIISNVKVTQ
ncbi:MAG: M15 family metallopeptidase, partial [Oscillospiraceae bacterium]|nr:M15 family metallopeptidase [Oscillospiraceae bacterium]